MGSCRRIALASAAFVAVTAFCRAGAAQDAVAPLALALTSTVEDRPSPRLELDPIADTTILATSSVMALGLQLILDTGELRPQEPGDPNDLLFLDRWRAGSDDVGGSSVISNLGLGLVLGYVGVDMVLSAVLDRGDPWVHYAVVYAETAAITILLTNIVKIAVRRPRPTAYRPNAVPDADDTNSALSFFSGHSAVAAGLSATAVYMAFAREAPALERWLVLLGGLALSTVVATARVAEGKHFPTDVIAGAAAGIGVGVMVPHLHAVDEEDGGVALSSGMGGVSLSLDF